MRRLEVSPGFWVLLTGVWVADPVLLWPLLGASLLHELGHLLALKALGGRVSRLRLTFLGAELRLDAPLSYRRELPAALAGPAVSLLTAMVGAQMGRFLFAGVSLALGVFNLLPIYPLDGGRAVRCVCALLLPEPWGQALPRWLAVAAAGTVLGAAGAAFFRFGGLSFPLGALWLCVQSVRELLWR